MNDGSDVDLLLEAEQLARRVHFYPGTLTLRNRFNIVDPFLLERAERMWVTRQLATRPAMPEISYAAFKGIHHHLFNGVYAWAGQERDYLTGRDKVPFELPEFIEPVMSEIFRHLNAFDDLRGCSADDFAWEAGVVANAINTCHPFINGNGRTLRAFLQDLAQQARYRIDYDYFGPDEWHAASRDAFQTQSGAPFHDLLRNAILPSKPHPETSAMADDTDASLLDRAGPVVAKTASAIGDAAEKASDLMGGFIDILSEGVWSLLGAPTQPSYLAGQPSAETRPADMPPPLVPEDPLLVYRKQKDEFESYAARHWHDEAGIARREAALTRARDAALAAHPHVFAAEEQANQKAEQGETASQQFRPH